MPSGKAPKTVTGAPCHRFCGARRTPPVIPAKAGTQACLICAASLLLRYAARVLRMKIRSTPGTVGMRPNSSQP
jgi:hypothetical protein